MSALCRSCGASIIWARTERGRVMPLDVKDSHEGRFELVTDNRGVTTAYARPVSELARGYTSHFATCPNAAKHRKPKP